MILLIDDLRNIDCDLIARNGRAGMRALNEFKGHIDELYLDHDLGEGVNGYQIAEWALIHEVMPRKVVIVTANPVGRDKIAMALENSGYTKKGQTIFEKQ